MDIVQAFSTKVTGFSPRFSMHNWAQLGKIYNTRIERPTENMQIKKQEERKERIVYTRIVYI